MSDRIAVMSAGRVQQIGTPREIYEAPVNRFVAEFIGQTNLLEVEVLGTEAGQTRVVLPGGQQILCAGAVAETGRRHLSIRPERLTLVPAGSGLAATVRQIVYLGTDLQLVVRLDGGAEMQLRLQNAARTELPEPGARVGLHLEEGAARLLAD